MRKKIHYGEYKRELCFEYKQRNQIFIPMVIFDRHQFSLRKIRAVHQ